MVAVPVTVRSISGTAADVLMRPVEHESWPCDLYVPVHLLPVVPGDYIAHFKLVPTAAGPWAASLVRLDSVSPGDA